MGQRDTMRFCDNLDCETPDRPESLTDYRIIGGGRFVLCVECAELNRKWYAAVTMRQGVIFLSPAYRQD
jgi:hypothetical protein